MVTNIIYRLLLVILSLFIYFNNQISIAQKKYATEQDYKKWTTMSSPVPSNNEKWVMYNKQNYKIYKPIKDSSMIDTLILKNLKSFKSIYFPQAYQAKFSKNSNYAGFIQNNNFVLYDLTKLKYTEIKDFNSYQFIANGELTILKKKTSSDTIYLLDNFSGKLTHINNVKSYTFSNDLNKILVLKNKSESNDYSLDLYDLKAKELNHPILHNTNLLSNFIWNKSDDLIAFYEQSSLINQELKLHIVDTRDLENVRTLLQKDLPSNYIFDKTGLSFSSDSKNINLIIKEKKEIIQKKTPLIWRSSDSIQPPDKIIYPKQKIVQWDINKNTLTYIPKDTYALASGDLNNFFFLDNTKYLPTYKFDAFYNDLYYFNSKTKKSIVIDTAFISANRKYAIAISPDNTYFSWIKEKDWWIFNTETSEKTCITCNVKDDFVLDKNYANHPNTVETPSIYSSDKKFLIITSQNNVYKYNLITKELQNLTLGLDTDYTYSIETNLAVPSLNIPYMRYQLEPINLANGLLIYGKHKKLSTEKLLKYDNNKLSLILSTPHKIGSTTLLNDGSVLYSLSNYNLSPENKYWKNNKHYTLEQSNKQQEKFYWGHSERITYKSPFSSELNAALYYPGNYDPNKKYPVIVYIYTSDSRLYKNYNMLQLTNPIAYSNSILTSNDYFVYSPDIEYKTNFTGESALKCVEAAIDAIKDVPGIDITRMGLFGNSFGGFETSYIATQTNMFKAIVSSSGWHDLVDAYLSIDDNDMFNYYRFEYNQLRINAPFYSKLFLDNSPILQAHKIKTPMLLIAGNKDRRVYWENSRKMQLALTKLGKESTFLLYDNEGHGLLDPNNQIDVNRKILQWWDYHLKNALNPSWNTKKM